MSMQSKPPRIILTAAALCASVIAAQAAEPVPVASAKASAAAPATFRGTGKLLDLDISERLITVDHDDMPSLGMPAMTMDFPVAASVDMQAVTAGQTVSFVLMVIDGLLTVTELRPVGAHQNGKKPCSIGGTTFLEPLRGGRLPSLARYLTVPEKGLTS